MSKARYEAVHQETPAAYIGKGFKDRLNVDWKDLTKLNKDQWPASNIGEVLFAKFALEPFKYNSARKY